MPAASNFEAKHYTWLDSGVRVDFYNRSGLHSSVLTSESAEVNSMNNNMTAYGHVHIVSDSGATVDTDSLLWDNKSQIVRSDAPVHIVEKNGRVTDGIGFESDQSLEHYHILRRRLSHPRPRLALLRPLLRIVFDLYRSRFLAHERWSSSHWVCQPIRKRATHNIPLNTDLFFRTSRVVVYKFGGALARTKRGIEALVKLLREVAKREAARARRRRPERTESSSLRARSAIRLASLVRAAELAEEGRLADAEDVLARVLEQHKQLAETLRIERETSLFDRFETIATEIGAWLEGVAIVRELSPRTRDGILASGERLGSALIEAVLRDRGLAIHAVPAATVILTDEQFGHAKPMFEEIARRAEKLIVPQLRKEHIVIVEGFSGATLDGLTTTMGNESSDLTATLLASVLGAEEVVIWKVLPGLYTADPELVKTPKLIRSLSFDEAEEIGRRGSRILFPLFAHPLSDRQTVLRIATPFGHLARHTTLQREAPPARKTSALGVTLEARLLPISFMRNSSAPRRGQSPVEAVLNYSVMSWASADEIHALVRKEEWRAAARSLSQAGTFAQGEPLAAISLIVRMAEGNSISSLLTIMARSLKAFHLHEILKFERSLIALVDDAEGLDALRKLHRDVFE